MSGDMANVSLQPVVTALQAAVTGTDIVTLFATGVSVSVAIVLVWFRLQVGLPENLFVLLSGRTWLKIKADIG